jgi:fucokinase
LPDGRASTIFDEFLIGLSGLSTEVPAGALIASGDVLLIFDHLQLTFRRTGVIGVAAAAPADMGRRHGVYVDGGGGHRVRAYLHKAAADDLARWAAVDADGTVQIDTGLVWLDDLTVHNLVSIAHEDPLAGIDVPREASTAASSAVNLNLYGDLLLPLAQSTTYEGYLADTSDGPATPAVQMARQVIWERLRGTPFTVERLQPAAFIHFGTSFEYWRMVAADPDLARLCDWTIAAAAWRNPNLQPVAQPDIAPESSLVLINSAAGGADRPGEAALVVDSHLDGSFAWSGAAIVAGVRTAQSLNLQRNVVVHQMPISGGGFVTRIFGLRDDPKRALDDPAATLMNQPWAQWLLDASDLIWPGLPLAARTLWNACLYPVATDREESLRLSLPLQDPAHASLAWQAQWQAAARLSLAESFAQADGERILADVAEVEDYVAARRFYAAIVAEQPAAEARKLLGMVESTVMRRCQQVAGWLAEADPILRMRGYKALAVATGDSRWEDRAFATLARMIEESVQKV